MSYVLCPTFWAAKWAISQRTKPDRLASLVSLAQLAAGAKGRHRRGPATRCLSWQPIHTPTPHTETHTHNTHTYTILKTIEIWPKQS